MTGWIVEKISRSGWRQKWRRFRPVTTEVSVRLVSAPRNVGGGRRRGGRGRLGGGSRGAGADRRLPRQLEEDVVEGRPPQAHVADADPGLPQRRRGFLHEDEALAGRREGQPVRAAVLLRRAAAHARERLLGLLPLPHVGELDLEDLAADAVLELVPGSFR